MRELNFCPHCGIQQSKFLFIDELTFFCKGCEGFFQAHDHAPRCPKCNSGFLRMSDYPSMDGESLFLCGRCYTHIRTTELLR